MIDIFSRFAVGWRPVRRSNAAIASDFAAGIMEKHKISPGHVVLHSDHGTKMTAETFLMLSGSSDH